METSEYAEIWTRNLEAQLALCRALEALADGLPDTIDRQDCLVVARAALPMLQRIHRFEETVLFPRLLVLAGARSAFAATLERLRFEHMEDESFAGEIHDALTGYVTGPGTEAATTLAYMLRGFFDNLARHVAFEREHLLPLLSAGNQ